MTVDAEQAIRSVLAMDQEIKFDTIDRAIGIMCGTPSQAEDACRVVSYKDTLAILDIHEVTLYRYIRNGYLKRVFGSGRKAIGINGNSLDAFRQRRIVHKGKPIQ